jgi:hypothetical protein
VRSVRNARRAALVKRIARARLAEIEVPWKVKR